MDNPLFTIRSLIRQKPNNEGYTEYGYRGTEELRIKDQQIEKLKQRIEELENEKKSSNVPPQHNRIRL
tara:strand:+ start:338 stop:541 length:204 start_codon:yes stop_codon:yes gene_type:complete